MRVYFKSKTPYFEKERDGLKCNTVRELGQDDSRFDDLINFIPTKEESYIIIKNPETNEEFERQITDVTYYDERFIISWHTPMVFKSELKQCHNSEFYGIECLESDNQFGFQLNDSDYRPAHQIWIKKEEAEKLIRTFYREFANNVRAKGYDFSYTFEEINVREKN